MKVLLLNLPFCVGGKKGVRAGSRWPHFKTEEEGDYLPFPFFLAYATALLNKNGFDAHLIDAIAEDLTDEELFRRIKKINPSIILIETSTLSLNIDEFYVKRIRQFSTSRIVFAGCDANIKETEFLAKNSNIDFVIYGEYEFPFLSLVKSIEGDKGLSDVPNLIFRNSEGCIIKNKDGGLCNLNELPWPDRDSVPIYKYLDSPGGMPLPCVQMLASRGCPYSCIFCAWPSIIYGGHNYRVRNIKDVVDEMEYLIKEKGFKSVYFDDDTFNIGKERILSLCSEIKKRSLNIPWAMMARADLVDKELLTAMKASGLYAVKYGVESSSQKLLNCMGKELNIDLAEENILLTKRLGIKVHLTFTFGVPGETKKTIKETIKFVLRMNPDSVQFSITTPFPGTDYFNMLKEKGQIISENWAYYDGGRKSVIKTDELSPEELEKHVKEAYKLWVNRQAVNNVCLAGNILRHALAIKEWSIKRISKCKFGKPDAIILIPPPYAIEMPLLAAAYLSTYLRAHGIRSEILDLNIEMYHLADEEDKKFWKLEYTVAAQRNDNVLRFINKHSKFIYRQLKHAVRKTNIIGFSVTVGNICFALELAKIIKKLRPATKIIFGGPFTFNEKDRDKLPEGIVDYIIVGEGEASLLELTQALRGKNAINGIPGVIVNTKYEKKSFMPRKPIIPLDNIPAPTFEEFNLDRYLEKNRLPILSSRGCINNCAFCSDCKITQHYRNRSAENIFNEINMSILKYNKREFIFLDLLCNGNVRQLETLCDLIIQSKLDISWVSYGIIRKEMTYSLMKKMKEARCHSIIFGLESGSDEVLKMMRKRYSVKDAEEVLKASTEAGLWTAINLIVGFPGETETHNKETCEFLRRNAKHINSITNLSTCVLMKGSDIYADASHYNITQCLSDELYWTAPENTFEIRNRRAQEILQIAKEMGIPITIRNNIKEMNEILGAKGGKNGR